MLVLLPSFLALFALIGIVVRAENVKPTLGVVANDDGDLVCVEYSSDKSLLAWGGFKDTISDDGWSYLSISSNSTSSNKVQAKAAGYVEGCLTHLRIYDFATIHQGDFGWSDNLTQFVDANYKFMNEQIVQADGTDPFWEQVIDSFVTSFLCPCLTLSTLFCYSIFSLHTSIPGFVNP
jgi:hypothetical protein